MIGWGRRWVTYLAIALGLILPIEVMAETHSIELNSEAAILMDAKTGQVLYERKGREKMYPASITKIVTGIMAVESGRLDEWAVASKRARWVDGTRIYLAEGEKKTLKDLVYGLMMHSGNDAAIVIAEHLSGSVERFAEDMNEFVRKTIGSSNTKFTNPHGLFDEEHYTTAYDMALLAKYAMQNQTFREIVATKKMPWHGDEWESNLVNHNKLLWRYEGASGIKNGYVSQSGNTLVASAKRGATELIAVVLKVQGSEKVYQDATVLLDYGFDHYETVRLLPKGKKLISPTGNEFVSNKDVYLTLRKEEQPILHIQDDGSILVQTSSTEKRFNGVLVKRDDPVNDPKKTASALEKNVDSRSLNPLYSIFIIPVAAFLYIGWLLKGKKPMDF